MNNAAARPPFAAPTAMTQVAAVIGDPVRHSLSPVLHNAAFSAAGLDWVYVALAVASGRGVDAVHAMRALGIGGLSVTMPHKTAVIGAVDVVSSDAALLGAANTIVRSGSLLCAHTTDGNGCIDALRADGFDPDGKSCMVIGAGGAGRAVVLALRNAGAASIAVVNRDASRAAAAVALGGAAARRAATDEADGCDLIVNATPLGMGTDVRLPVDPDRLGPGQVVNDLVYHPLVTPLLSAAAARGARTVGGVGMLLYQAGRQFTLWTAEPAPIDAMRAAVAAELAVRAG